MPKEREYVRGKVSAEPNKSLMDLLKAEPVKTIHAMISSTDAVMAPRATVWQRYRRKYRRGLYYLKQDNGRAPLYFTNYIYSIVEVLKAQLTRNLPHTAVRAKGAVGDQLAAELLGRIVRGELIRAGIKRKLQGTVQHAVICGLGWLKIGLDPDANGGEGGLAIDTCAPEDVLVDPMAFDHRDARWIIHRKKDVPYDKIFAAYGKRPEVREDPDSEGNGVISTERSYGQRNRNRPAAEITPMADVYECWIRNYDTTPEEPEEGVEGGESVRKPDWYIITLAGETVVRDLVPSPYAHNLAPFVPLFDVEDSGAENIYYRGVGEVEEIEPLQDRADALDQRIYQAIAMIANRQRYISSQSGLNANAMNNNPGHNYQVNGDPRAAVHYDNPPMLSREVYGYREATELLIQVVSGMFDAMQGRRPVGVVAGRAIQSLQEAAATRVVFKVDSLAESLKDVMHMAIQIVLQFYDGERLMRLTDADKDQTVRIIDDYPPLGEGMEMSDEEKAMFREQNMIDLVLAEIDFDYDIEVDPDSALPQSRVDRAQLATDLFRLGAIDRRALLEMLDFPNREQILKRLGESVTGQNAGDPMAENGDVLAMMQEQMAAMGLPPEMIQQIMGAMQQGGQPQPKPGGGIPPQVAM